MPSDPSSGQELFALGCRFVKGVTHESGLPLSDRGEIAFAGRSNVGKSSLINALTGRRALARTSNTPGRTREVNFFDLAGLYYLVDLPGYGYAKASKTSIAKWHKMTRAYLLGRASLRRVYQLIDSRHDLKPNDLELMDVLDRGAVSYQIVLTKVDKISKEKREHVQFKVSEAIRTHPAAYPEVLLTSSEKKFGIKDLQDALFQVLAPPC